MKIKREIDSESCDKTLVDQARLRYIQKQDLLSEARDQALDRLTSLASKLLNAPLTIISVVGEDKQVFKSFHGLPEPWASAPSIPIDNSVCRYTFSGDILSLEDASEQPLLKGNPAVPALNLTAYLGIPLITKDGHILGAFCAIDYKKRKWSEKEIDILKELTSSVMSEISLKLALKELEFSQRERENIIAMLAHDLRSPLSVILSSAELIELEKDVTKEILEETDRIKRSVKLANTFINNFLDHELAHLDAEELPKEKTDLKKVLNEVVQDFKASIAAELILDSSMDSCFVHINKVSILRAIVNLIGNAAKYGDTSRPIKVNLTKDKKGNALISVHNFGDRPLIGDKKELFSPFVRGENVPNETSGKGLGLALVNSVAEYHGGSIDFISDLKAGTTFYFTLPAF